MAPLFAPLNLAIVFHVHATKPGPAGHIGEAQYLADRGRLGHQLRGSEAENPARWTGDVAIRAALRNGFAVAFIIHPQMAWTREQPAGTVEGAGGRSCRVAENRTHHQCASADLEPDQLASRGRAGCAGAVICDPHTAVEQRDAFWLLEQVILELAAAQVVGADAVTRHGSGAQVELARGEVEQDAVAIQARDPQRPIGVDASATGESGEWSRLTFTAGAAVPSMAAEMLRIS